MNEAQKLALVKRNQARGGKPRLQLVPEQEVHPSILIEETIERFGYDPRCLKVSSQKLVVKKFGCCGKTEQRKFRTAATQHKCLNCSNRDNARSVDGRRSRSELMKLRYLDPSYKHPTKGIGHTDEAKRKIRANRKPYSMREKLRQEFSIRFSGSGNPFYGKRHKPESLRRGKDSPAYGKSPAHTFKVWYERRDGLRVCFRSTWEARVATYLDQRGIDWEYESKVFPVQYEWCGRTKQSTYRADFWLPATDSFIEVKGLWRPEYLTKYEALRKQYDIKIEVWDRAALKERGIYTGKSKGVLLRIE